MKALLVTALFAVTALAGCSDSGGDGGDPTATPTIDPNNLKEGKGALQGLIVDDEFRPIPNALLLLDPVGRTTRSTENGEFSFNDLDPAAYSIRGQAPGYEVGLKNVEVKEGIVEEVFVEARRIVNQGGQVVVSEYEVFIPCTVGILGGSATFGCLDASGENYKTGPTTDYQQTQNLTYVVIEIHMRDEAYYSADVRDYSDTAGSGPNYADATVENGHYMRMVIQPGNVSADGGSDAWNNDIPIKTAVFYLGTDPSGTGNAAGFAAGVRGTVVHSVFLGKPDVDIATYCVLCE